MSKINYWKVMTRKKPMPVSDGDDSKFNRVFGTFDLTALGVSATLGVGVYVLAGHVAKLEAGPSVILSFFIAAGASFLAGLCYAEFSSRVPKSGSAYVFTYVAIGEFIAFIIGWNLLLEYIIGSASIAKGLSLYIDSLINDTMKNFFKQIAPMTSTGNFLSSYFDFFAFSGPLLLGLALAFGLRKSAGMNNILCILNLCVVFFVVIIVLIYANLDYWQIDPDAVPSEYKDSVGTGGFFPFGFSGTLKGAATCFFGFVGFDCIATTGEEVRNPRKSVPRAILYSLIIIFFAYFGVSLLTLMWPYYLLDADAPLPHAFNEKGLTIPKWIVTIGGIVGLIASLFGAMFPLPRILYAMSSDGLIFKAFGVISKRFKTPVIGTLCAAALTSCFAGLFDLAALVNMLSIGVLLAYTVVAISIIVLRFSQSDQIAPNSGEGFIETSNLLRPGYNITTKGFFMQLLRLNSSRQPNTISTAVVGIMITCYCIVSLTIALIITYGWEAVASGETWALVALITLAALLVLFCLLISIQPRQQINNRNKPFMVPLVPFLPAISVFINIYLMLMLDYYTWIRFGIWMIIGFILYFPYAWYYHNHINKNNQENNTKVHAKENEIEKAASTIENQKSDEKKIQTVITNISEEKNIKIVDETHQNEASSSEMDAVINNKASGIDENHLIIEILDTIDEEEKEENDKQKEMSQSIKENVTETNESEEKSDENLSSNAVPIIIDQDDLISQVDDILEQAVEIVSTKINEKNIQDEDDDNIFHNEKFLTHLSDLILSNKINTQKPRTLQHKKKSFRENEKKFSGLKHSSSAPDLQEILRSESNKNNLNNTVDTNADFQHKNNKEERKSEGEEEVETNKVAIKKIKTVVLPKPPQVNNTELLEKFEEMKKKRLETGNPIEVSENTDSSEDESLDKEEFREKLEKLLRNPPKRLSMNRPIPLPRTSIKRDEEENTVRSNLEESPNPWLREKREKPISAAMQRQRLIFDEVLKNIKKDEI